MAANTSQVTHATPAGTAKFYYTVANHHILLEDGLKTEIIEPRQVFAIPHAPPWCLGMISLRGKLIPVANLHALLSAAEPTRIEWILVLEKAPLPELAVCIDRLPQQQRLNNEPRKAVNHEKLPHWLRAKYAVENKTLYEADHGHFFEQLIRDNEHFKTDMMEHPLHSTQDSSGNKA